MTAANRVSSLPLDRRRRLAGDVVDDARDAGDLVDDAPRDVIQELVRQARPVRGHEIDRLDRAQRDHVVVTAAIAHHSDRAHRQENRERLAHAVVEVVSAELLDEDGVGTPQQIGIFLAHLTEDADAKARAGEGMAVDHLPWQAELDPERMHLELIEPLRELFKDEVRRLGIELGLPREMVYRHPFPGPGLGVRILGEVRKEYADLLRRADHIFIEELRRHDLYERVSQAFAVFLPVRSVGVMGDGRRYDYVVALRAVETVDFMTAQWARLPYEFLEHVSRRIVNEVPGISRVVYDISGKPPATIEWE